MLSELTSYFLIMKLPCIHYVFIFEQNFEMARVLKVLDHLATLQCSNIIKKILLIIHLVTVLHQVQPFAGILVSCLGDSHETIFITFLSLIWYRYHCTYNQEAGSSRKKKIFHLFIYLYTHITGIQQWFIVLYSSNCYYKEFGNDRMREN